MSIVEINRGELDGGEPLQGVSELEQHFSDNPEVLGTHLAFGLISGLRVTEPALATGKDIHILGVESLELVETILGRMAEPESSIGYRVVLGYFSEKAGASLEQMQAVVGEYATAIQAYRHNAERLSNQERHEELDNLRPMTHYLLYLSESVVNRQLEGGMSLPFEGADLDSFHNDLLRDVCDPFYLNFVFDEKAAQPSTKSGFSGQSRLRLMDQARAFGMAQTRETSPQ